MSGRIVYNPSGLSGLLHRQPENDPIQVHRVRRIILPGEDAEVHTPVMTLFSEGGKMGEAMAF